MATIDKTLRQAAQLMKSGELVAARELYNTALAKYPSNKRLRSAANSMAQTSVTQPVAHYLKTIIDAYNQGRLAQALQSAQSFTAAHPLIFDGWNILGASAAQAKQFDIAARAFRNALALQPDNAQGHNNVGNVLNSMGHHIEALKHFEIALRLEPSFSRAHNNKGNAFMGLGKWDEAIEAYEAATKLNSKYADAFFNMGIAYGKLRHLDREKAALEKAVALAPKNANAQLALAVARSKSNENIDAHEAFNAALNLRPNWLEARLQQAAHFKDMGNRQAATDAYRSILQDHPLSGEAARNLLDVATLQIDDPLILQMQNAWNNHTLTTTERCQFGFALYKAHEAAKHYDAAYDYLTRANQLRRQGWNYTIERDETLFSNIQNTHEQIIRSELASTAPIFSQGYKRPIFILGMPRSGTSLVEQIVSAHHDVSGGGELYYLYDAAHRVAKGDQNFTPEMRQAIQNQYLENLQRHDTGTTWITDKMPQNFLLIGVIKLCIPGAQIIHVTRDAGAVCWSNFKSFFGGTGMGHAYDIHDTVRYYQLYQNIMAYWQSCYPNDIYTLNYDELVSNPKRVSQDLIAALGLDWDIACLTPHKNERAVRTVSKLQVRQPIYTGSSEAWKAYKQWLSPVFSELYPQKSK